MAQHFTLEERQVLYRLNKAGKSQAEIGRLLGRHRSSIGRELKRNTGGRGYRPQQAQRLAEERRQHSRRGCKLADRKMKNYVLARLNKYWSPDQIAGRARKDFPRQPERHICGQTIYNWIDRESSAGNDWRWCLRRHGKRRGPSKRGQLKGCVSIEGRPKIIDRRQRYGDWEGDTVVGPRSSGLLTAVERKSGYLSVAKLKDRRAASVVQAARKELGLLPAKLRRTMTFDNGKEFAQHQKIGRSLGMDIYFAEPYCAWQRGTNENTNGLLRQFFPKRTDFHRISHQAVARMKRLLNERPRRRLNYQTPAEIIARRRRCV